jgi:Protein of unknown function (DUF2911)
MLGPNEIRVRYIRPVARGRALFGGLVEYGKVWTPSADSALLISFTRDVEVDGKPLPAGSYSVWAIPDTTRWTLIFNRTARVFHTLRNYDEREDALRVTANVDSLPHVETLTASFPLVDARKAVFQLQWGTTAVSVRLETR